MKVNSKTKEEIYIYGYARVRLYCCTYNIVFLVGPAERQDKGNKIRVLFIFSWFLGYSLLQDANVILFIL